MVAAGGWAEPWQTPEFDEWVIVTKGRVMLEHTHGRGGGENMHSTDV
jgi:hypothetical protein